MMAETVDIDHRRARRYRVGGPKTAVIADRDPRMSAEPMPKNWACVDLDPSPWSGKQIEGRRGYENPYGRKKRSVKPSVEPSSDLYTGDELRGDLDYYLDPEDDGRDPLPERDGVFTKAGRLGAAAWNRFRFFGTVGTPDPGLDYQDADYERYRFRGRHRTAEPAGPDPRTSAEPSTKRRRTDNDSGLARRAGYQTEDQRNHTLEGRKAKSKKRSRKSNHPEEHVDQHGYYLDAAELESFGEPLAKRKPVAMRAGLPGGLWNRLRRGFLRDLVALIGVFTLGVVLEYKVQFLGWVTINLTAIALAVRERGWLNISDWNVLLWAGLSLVTGMWLLRRVLWNTAPAPRRRKGVHIPRKMMDHYR